MALTEAQEREKQKHIDYWTRREAEQKKHNITDEEGYSKELQRIYNDMLDNVQKEIDAFYGKYAKQNNITLAEAKKAVSKLDIEAYERKAKRYVKEKNFSKEANEEMRLYNLTMKVNRLEMLKANIGLELISGHDELEKFMEGILKGRTMEELERQAGILGETIINNAQTANAIVNASFHNAKFSDRIWMHQDLLKNELGNLLQTGLIAGRNPRVLAKEIEKKFGVKRSDAERLMRTELARVQTEAQKQSFEKNGFEMYTFLALGDACPICKDIHGKHFKVKDMVIALNAAPMHPHCRCSMAAYEDDDDYNAWLEYLEAGGTTEEWNKLTSKQKANFAKTGNILQKTNKKQKGNATIELEDKGDLYTDLGALSDNLVEASLQVNNILNALDLPESKWSGRTIIKKVGEMLALGRKKKNCDIWLSERAPIKTVIHEHLHARSSSRMTTKFAKDRCFEEGACELLAEEICKKNGISYKATYKEYVEPLRKFNKINGKHESEYEFAMEFFRVDMDKRERWLVEIAEQSRGIKQLRLKNQIKKMRDGNE